MKTMAVGTAPESENGKPAAKRQRLALEETAHFNEPFGDPEVDNVRIRKIQAMLYPQLLMDEYPETRFTKELVCRTRKEDGSFVCAVSGGDEGCLATCKRRRGRQRDRNPLSATRAHGQSPTSLVPWSWPGRRAGMLSHSCPQHQTQFCTCRPLVSAWLA